MYSRPIRESLSYTKGVWGRKKTTTFTVFEGGGMLLGFVSYKAEEQQMSAADIWTS